MHSVRDIWAAYCVTGPAEGPGSALDILNQLLKYDDSVITACLHEVLSPSAGGRRAALLKATGFLDATHDRTDRWTDWVVALFPDLSLFDFLQAVGFHNLARLVAQAAAESMADGDLPGAGRDWFQELEDGIERH
ncbi:hypothetical protein ABH920_000161 [Catenulispora sp. EB89]|uniref:hypothetical protein n=1 Tax=Catenulispora sp. EB89 TaxID=3156257 RepID=UPI003512CDFB